ncbi:hypothetical protein AB0K35_27945 [Micromonospora sp. NPDC053740]|uniref:hypothetical protein n=1 Tax=Micromonospora TaxID=1873 RepID=UPI001EE7EA6B|nr:hypothetical protein [Micromonospora alfalfae]MCG5464246.1 hypothetical protein [Micromonospora alfalfae]
MTYTVRIEIESAKGIKRRTVRNATTEHITHLRNWARTNTPAGASATVTVN